MDKERERKGKSDSSRAKALCGQNARRRGCRGQEGRGRAVAQKCELRRGLAAQQSGPGRIGGPAAASRPNDP